MAKLAELYYWTGDNPNHNITDQWKRAETAQSGNALNYVEFTHEIGNAAEAYITLLNPVPNPFSGTLDKKTGPLNILTASEDDGTASAVFADLQRVYLRDPETKIILIAGRIYDIENDFNKMQGHTVNLRVKDELEMLRGVYTTDLDTFSISGGTTKRSDVIKTSLIGNAAFNTPAALGLSNKIDTSDSNRFNDSLRTYPTNYVGTIDSKKSNSNLLGIIAELAQEDPNDSTSTTIADNFGYDYYLDHNFQSVDNSGADTTTPPTPHLNYFPRGTRPNSNVSSFGLTVEFPTTGTFAETGQKVPMLDDFDFERPKNEIFTDCTLDGIKNKQGEFTKNFEIINVSSISGTFTWSEKEFSNEIDRTLSAGTTAAETLNLLNADGSGSPTAVATVQYQSKTSGSGYLLISDLKSAFPSGTTQVMLKGASSNVTCLFTPSTGRPREKLGVKRTFRTKYGLETDPDNIRKKISAQLSRSGSSGTDIIRGSFSFPRMPYFFKDATPSSTSSTVFNMSINPESYGFEKGMTVGTLDSSSNLEDFSYASDTSSSSITTTGISDTSGSAGSFSGSVTGRFFVPVRAGDMIYVSNPTESITSNMLVTKLEFRQGAGLGHNTRVEVVGKDAAVAGKVAKITISNVDDGSGTEGTRVPRGQFNFSFPDDGSNNAITFTASAHNAITVEGGPILFDNGEKFTISDQTISLGTAFDGSSKTQKASTTFIIYFDPDASETAFQAVLQNGFDAVADHNTTVIGTARAAPDSTGLAEFNLGNSPEGLTLGSSQVITGSQFQTRPASDGSNTATASSAEGRIVIKDDQIIIHDGESDTQHVRFFIGGSQVAFLGMDNSSGPKGLGLINYATDDDLDDIIIWANNGQVKIRSEGDSATESPTVVSGGFTIQNSGVGAPSDSGDPALFLTAGITAALKWSIGADAAASYALKFGTDTAVGTNTKLTLTSSGYLRGVDGSNSLPTYGFASDDDTGFYYYSTGFAGITGGGTASAAIGAGYVYANTGYTFLSDQNTTIVADSDVMTFRTGGGIKFRLNQAKNVTDNTGTSNSITFVGAFEGAMYAGGTSYFNGVNPLADDSKDIGSASYRWDDIFATNSTINTSDKRMKEDIKPVELGLDFIDKLKPVSYKWKKKKEHKPDQTHFGIIAQDVVETLKEYDIDDFGGITGDGKEEWYGARYTEFIAILIKGIQELKKEIEELKENK